MEGEAGSLTEAAAVGAAVATAEVAGAAEVTAEHAAGAAEDAASAAEGATEAAEGAVAVAAAAAGQAEETQRGVMEILTLHGENISALRAELAADREERQAFHTTLLEVINRGTHHAEETDTGAGSEVEEQRLPAEGGESGEDEREPAEQQPEPRSGGRRWSKHF